MQEGRLDKELQFILKMMNKMTPNLSEDFMLGEPVDSFLSLPLTGGDAYVFEVVCLEDVATTGYADTTHTLTLSYRKVGERSSIFEVVANVRPDGMYGALEVMYASPEAEEIAAFGRLLQEQVEENWPEL